MAEVRVRYTGQQPIVVNGKTWLQDEIHCVNEKTAKVLVEMRAQYNDIFVLPLPGMVDIESLIEVTEEKPTKRRRR